MVYGPVLVIGALALLLGWRGQLLFAVALLLAAVWVFWGLRQVLAQKAAAEQQQALVAEQLLQSQKLAAIGELSAGIAHEINNPLAIIRQEAEWLLLLLKKQSPPDLEEMQNSLVEIIQQVDRSRAITHNLLDFARRRQPVLQKVDLNRVLEDMSLLVAKEASHRNITIIKDLEAGLPLIKSDAPLLRQAFLNLMNNALQAMEQGGTLTIISRTADNHHLLVQVNDTGCGIPKEHLPRIFDPFFTTKPHGKGTGLGLSICHGIIERLGGKITVSSEVGKGSSFTVLLPRNLPPEEKGADDRRAESSPGG